MGLAGILSGVHFVPKKVDDLFSAWGCTRCARVHLQIFPVIYAYIFFSAVGVHVAPWLRL